MNALFLVLVALSVFALAYRYYGLFIARKVLEIDPGRPTPAITMADGHDYQETNRYVLFGHHFAAIAAAGPLIGPVLAAQFGYLPGALWIIIGAVVAGAVHDMVSLFASVRHQGRSLPLIAEKEIGSTAGIVASFAMLFILILTLSGLSISVVNALFDSPWGLFTVLFTIPIALIMGLYIHVLRPGDVKGGSILGVILLTIVIYLGPYVAANPVLAPMLTFSKNALAVSVPIYGFAASVLPVWLLLCPRDYLSTYLKLGTISALALGIFLVHPEMNMPAVTSYVHGGGPIIQGSVFPFLFITIACGALSGFHSIIASGTTPKMISSEKDILFIGYGAMLVEGFVAIMALIAACVLLPQDYFAINASSSAYAALGMTPVHLPQLAAAVGETLQGRTGGGVSLAVGMAYIFSSISFMSHLMGYWYHFVLMFEALFILTAVDTGTRAGRYLLQEMVGRVIPKFSEKKWMPGIAITSFLFTVSWGYLLYTGNITTIWPIFGMSNQLLAACALIIGTTMILRMGKGKYALITAVPGLFMIPVTFSAGYLNIVTNYLPKGQYLLVFLSAILMFLTAIMFIEAFKRWYELIQTHGKPLNGSGRMPIKADFGGACEQPKI
ncbi:carbon starvation CstA family protein [Methanosarcina sp. UBA5]|uniref:carbon starvation CstA family protein n=1 Tax=Methanosarcina sp. UBA5 TaxID=1915593 RepID=UPI0025D3672C|nr:carbon starvation protein A [Methanosarcina sp. UBA5]